MADGPTVYYFKNILLIKAEHSACKMGSKERGCVTYGRKCTRAGAVMLVKGCKAVSVRAWSTLTADVSSGNATGTKTFVYIT
jgi:hypothetical protein